MAVKNEQIESEVPSGLETVDHELENTLYARHQEIEQLKELAGKENQLGTPIPALFSVFYKFIQNPSTVSVETYKRMVDTDDTIGSGVDFLTTCLAARLGRYQHPSEEISEFINKRLEEIEGGFFNAVKEILSATWVGYSVTEKVWGNTDKGFVPKKLVTLPPTTVLFETDRTGEITEDGILQYQRNYNPAFMGSAGFYSGSGVSSYGFATDNARPDMFAKFGDIAYPMRSANSFNYLSVRIPKLKCIHYSFDAQGKFGNPYGRSLLRRAYKYYVVKDAVLQMMAVALDRKGTPLTVVYADPNTTMVDPSQAARGSETNGARGRKVGKTAQQSAQEAFKNVHNDTTIVLPGKKGEIFDIDFVPQDANTEAFIAALDFCNKSFLRALLIPALIFGNGDGTGSNALGQEHSKTFDKILDGVLAGAKQVLIQQLVREMICYNFPAETWKEHGFGDFSKREFTQDELEKVMDMYDKAITSGIIDANDLNDLNQMRETLGFEPRTEIIEKPDMFGGGEIDPETGLPMAPAPGEGGGPFGAEPEIDETKPKDKSGEMEQAFAKRQAARKGSQNPADNFRK